MVGQLGQVELKKRVKISEGLVETILHGHYKNKRRLNDNKNIETKRLNKMNPMKIWMISGVPEELVNLAPHGAPVV